CSSHLSPMHRLYHLHILHYYHFAICTFITHTHTHTSTRPLSCTTHPLKHKYIIYIFCTIHTSSTRSLSSWTQTLSKSLHITIGSDPFPVSRKTLCGNVLPMCMYICSPYVYVYVYVINKG